MKKVKRVFTFLARSLMMMTTTNQTSRARASSSLRRHQHHLVIVVAACSILLLRVLRSTGGVRTSSLDRLARTSEEGIGCLTVLVVRHGSASAVLMYRYLFIIQ